MTTRREAFRGRAALPYGAALFVLLAAFAGFSSSVHAAPSAQVTSELSCTQDSDCPAHDFPCSVTPWFPTCGCDEGSKRCDPNPKGCNGQSSCFGQEACSRDGHCTEPAGFPKGAACNVDLDCQPWLACLLGTCNEVDCAVDGDCRAGQTCQRTHCSAPTGCHADTDCGDREVCRDSACHRVQCRFNADCGSCQICDSGNRCANLCPASQRCASFVVLDPSPVHFATILQRCVEKGTLTCTGNPTCPVGQQCLGGHCLSLPKILDEIGGRRP